MPIRCKNCGAKVIPRPLWKGQEFGEPLIDKPFSWEKLKGKLIWKNWLLPDLTSMLIYLAIIFMIWSYAHDTQSCRGVMENPCEYVFGNIEACNLREQSRQSPFGITIPNNVKLPDYNNT